MAALFAFFAFFFGSLFYIDFLSILDRFRRGFGRVSGGQNGAKIDISGVLGGICFEVLFLSDFCKLFDKIEDEKYMDF